MLHFQLQVVFVVLFCSVLLVEVRGAPRSDMLTERLKEDLAYNKDLSPWLLLKFMSELTAARGDELLPEPEEVLGVREEVMRRQLPSPTESAKQAAGTSSGRRLLHVNTPKEKFEEVFPVFHNSLNR